MEKTNTPDCCMKQAKKRGKKHQKVLTINFFFVENNKNFFHSRNGTSDSLKKTENQRVFFT